MKLGSIFGALFILAVLVLLGVYYLAPYTDLELSIKPRNYNFSTTNESGMQFYNNMRFPSTDITYLIDDGCVLAKKQNMKDAFEIMENKTSLKFYPTAINQDISITCSERNRYEKGIFIAGEGGASKIVKLGDYKVIVGGTI